MNRQQLLDLHKATCEKAFSIFEAKNIDYASSDDPLANFKATEILGIPAELGVLTRCLDKFQRIKSFVDNGTLAVKSESVNDAIEDVINYMVLLKGVIEDKVGKASSLAKTRSAVLQYEGEVRDATHNIQMASMGVTIHPPLPSASEQSEETLLTPCAHANTTSVCIPVYEEIITFTCDDCDMVMIDSVWLHREYKKVLAGTDVTYPDPSPLAKNLAAAGAKVASWLLYSPEVGDLVIVNDETREISDVEGQVAEVVLNPQRSQYAIRVAIDPPGTNIYADVEHLTKKEVTE